MSADPSASRPTAANGAAGADAPTERIPAAEATAAAARAEAAAARAESAARSAAAGAGPGTAAGGAPPPAGAGQVPPIYMLQGENGQPLLAIPQLPQLTAGGAQAPPQGARGQRRDWTFWVPVTILGVLAACGLLTGIFFVGRATRPSNEDISARVARAVAAAQATGDAGRRRALAAQRELLVARANERVRRARESGFSAGKEQGYADGQSAGYASGQAAGRTAGFNEGKAAGFSEGSSQGFLQGLNLATPVP